MRRVNHLTERIASLDNLYEAYRKACRGKHCKQEVLAYGQHLDDNLALLRQQVLSGDVEVGRYHYFVIFEPKRRVICAASFGERVLHHAIMNVCHDCFDRSLIDTTYATRIGKGLYAAIDKAIVGIHADDYTAKLDVRKYFDSIDHARLKDMLCRKFKDKTLLRIFFSIIDSYHTAPGKGLPIGNLSSQYLANMYLSPLDHYAKQQLHAPLYIRYMDDILLACHEKTVAKETAKRIILYAIDVLGLEMKPPVIRPGRQGQNFLGYQIRPHRIYLSGRSKRRFRSKLLIADRLLAQGIWTEEKATSHVTPLLAFTQHAVSHRFRRACLMGYG